MIARKSDNGPALSPLFARNIFEAFGHPDFSGGHLSTTLCAFAVILCQLLSIVSDCESLGAAPSQGCSVL